MQARADFYRAVARAATGVIVSSHHEASLFAEYVDATIGVEVIPLMFDTVRVDKPSESAELTVGVLGYLYPGKGAPGDTAGYVRPRPVHRFRRARHPRHPATKTWPMNSPRSPRRWDGGARSRGFLTDDELIRASAEVTVPAAYHRHMSASGRSTPGSPPGADRWSRAPPTPMNSPLVPPGVLTMHANNDAALRTALESAFANPASTWIDPAVTPSPTAADVGRAHERLVRRWSA